MTLLPQGLECAEGRMQAKKAVEIEDFAVRNIDAGPHGVVLRLGMWNDDVESVGGSTLENYNEAFGAGAAFHCTECSSSQKAGNGSSTDDCQRTVAKEYASGWHGSVLSQFQLSAMHYYLRWNSGEPNSKPASVLASGGLGC